VKVISLLVPQSGPVEVDELCARFRSNAGQLRPFDPATLAFCNSFSRALFQDSVAKRFPELQALAFWMRKSEVHRMKEQFEALGSERTLLMPRGLVFHIPPSNVDTIFIYSWILSVLVGNSNIIRFSERAGEAATTICRLLAATLAQQDAALQYSTAIVRYGRDQAITAAFSAACDVRVIWGGDATVNSIRTLPLPPHATELTFPDRYSLVVLRASAYLALQEKGRQEIAGRFYNDTFWFDQMACSSPRTTVWVGSQEDCASASRQFYLNLDREVKAHSYVLPTGPRLNKMTFAYRAILDQPAIEHQERYGAEITVLQLANLADVRREHCGGGLLFEAWTPALNDLATLIGRRDQTITHFGFEAGELRDLVYKLGGRGGDRFVPIGQALTFNRFWDGYDLMREFTRAVYIQA
jgi:Acyl-CoA reductase (LuxC)